VLAEQHRRLPIPRNYSVINNAQALAPGVSSTAMGSPRFAQNQARYRARQRHPLRGVYRIEVEQERAIEALVKSGRLAEDDAGYRSQVEESLSLTIAAWIDEVLA